MPLSYDEKLLFNGLVIRLFLLECADFKVSFKRISKR